MRLQAEIHHLRNSLLQGWCRKSPFQASKDENGDGGAALWVFQGGLKWVCVSDKGCDEEERG